MESGPPHDLGASVRKRPVVESGPPHAERKNSTKRSQEAAFYNEIERILTIDFFTSGRFLIHASESAPLWKIVRPTQGQKRPVVGRLLERAPLL